MLLPCKACGSSCSAVCEGCSRCLCPENKPSPLFVIFSSVMNLLCLLFAIIGLTAEKNDVIDYGPTTMWLGVCMGIAIGNMIFACYLYWRFAHLTQPATDSGKPLSSSRAACQLFLYDIGVLIYLAFCVFMIVWCVIKKECESPEGVDDGGYCDDQHDAISRCKLILGLYMGLGLVVIFLSVCTECCRPPRYVTHQQQVGYQAYNGQPVPYNQAAPAYQQPPPHQQPPHQQPLPQQQTAYPPAPQPNAGYPQQNPGYAPPAQQYGQPQEQPYGQQPYGQQQGQPPQQNQTMATKAGTAVGGLIGKGVNALKK